VSRFVDVRSSYSRSAPNHYCSRPCGLRGRHRSNMCTRPSGCPSVLDVDWPPRLVLLLESCGVLLEFVSLIGWPQVQRQTLNICLAISRFGLLLFRFRKEHSPASNSIFFFAACSSLGSWLPLSINRSSVSHLLRDLLILVNDRVMRS
jgi:hypothetical protein